MANIQSVRQRLRTWLTSLCRIDSFDADPPRELWSSSSTQNSLRPANTCIEYPVKDLVYTRTDLRSVSGRGTFSYAIVYRYPGELTLDELPIVRLEGVVQYLQAMSLLSLAGSNGIKHVQPDAEEFPIQVVREEADQGDWLIYANVVLVVEFHLTDFDLDPDFSPIPEQPIDFNELNIAVNRAKAGFDSANPDDYTLDTQITISKD